MGIKISLPITAKLGETTKALHIRCKDKHGIDRQVYIPFSQIYEIHPDRIVITDWIAKTKELI